MKFERILRCCHRCAQEGCRGVRATHVVSLHAQISAMDVEECAAHLLVAPLEFYACPTCTRHIMRTNPDAEALPFDLWCDMFDLSYVIPSAIAARRRELDAANNTLRALQHRERVG